MKEGRMLPTLGNTSAGALPAQTRPAGEPLPLHVLPGVPAFSPRCYGYPGLQHLPVVCVVTWGFHWRGWQWSSAVPHTDQRLTPGRPCAGPATRGVRPAEPEEAQENLRAQFNNEYELKDDQNGS